jgi:hypothetical protein
MGVVGYLAPVNCSKLFSFDWQATEPFFTFFLYLFLRCDSAAALRFTGFCLNPCLPLPPPAPPPPVPPFVCVKQRINCRFIVFWLLFVWLLTGLYIATRTVHKFRSALVALWATVFVLLAFQANVSSTRKENLPFPSLLSLV